jgi:ribosomal protein S18 acetylase RimI-like enzyme
MAKHPAQSVLVRLYDPARDTQALRDCIIEQQDFHRGIEPTWPEGKAIFNEYLDYLKSQCEEHDGAVIVAEAGEKMVGFVCVVASAPGASPDDPAVHAWVHDLFVRPEYRHQGIATRLMVEAESFARQRRAGVVRLGVLDGNDGARAFYRGRGFREYVRVLTKPLE